MTKYSNRILVSGGGGFIGSHLISKLLENNNYVICIDNFTTGDKSLIEKHMNNNNFELIVHDVTEPITLEIDQIYHLACPASPMHYQKNPISTLKTCFLGTLNMLGLAKRSNAKIILASTSEIYGDPLIHPQSEDYVGNVNCIGDRSCYDEGKRISETLAYEYTKKHQLDIRIARIFNTYGPNMLFNDGRVVSNFIYQALNNEALTIYGDGSQTRSFCYISDLVDGLLKLMEIDRSILAKSNTNIVFNLGNPDEYKIIDFANLIKEYINPNIGFIYQHLPSDDPKQRCPNIYKAKQILEWEPKVKVKEGILLTIENFRERILK